MQVPPKAPELSGIPDLPTFSDRLPDLIQSVRIASQNLAQARANESYIPYWEELYSTVHGIKGGLTLLQTPPEMAAFVLKFCDTINEVLSGPFLARDKKNCSLIFSDIAEILEHPTLKHHEGASLIQKLGQLQATFSRDLEHAERLQEMSKQLFYISDLVSKRAREVKLLQYNDCVVEDTILLDQIPFWRTQLQDALNYPEFGRGLVVNFLPFLSSEGSRAIRVWSWVAAASSSRATLKQRIKDVMPKVNITKI